MIVKNGYNVYSKEEDANKVLMDVGVLKLKKGQDYLFKSSTKEKAILIWNGKINLELSNQKNIFTLSRKNIWEDHPMAFHCSKESDIKIKALEDSEMILQSKSNSSNFEHKIYDNSNCKVGVAGKNYKPSTSTRYVIDIINNKNAPYSNMVLGEVFTKTGHWSGYPPHKHDQPEIYVYRFNKEKGFGIGLVDEESKIVKNYDSIFIPGGKDHQNACAPGYQMYFTWMISHLANNPWTNSRDYDKDHEWINKKDLEIKDSKKIK